MKRTRTSKAWMMEHVNDAYVQRAKAEGYRSRAAFKLLEIDERDHLMRPGMVVVDLGAAPGSWSQVALKRVGVKGRVIALDLLPVEAMPGLEFIQGDFQEDAVLEQLESLLAGAPVDLVLSDMAPNMSGIELTDQARSVYLAELALDFAARVIALDLLPVEAMPGLEFIQGDFQEDAVLEQLESLLAGAPVDLVLSDMAPNMSGIELTDQARSVYLAELALDFAARHLKPGGKFLVKVFQGAGFMAFRQVAQESFTALQVRKPKASRDRSAEVYLLGNGFKTG